MLALARERADSLLEATRDKADESIGPDQALANARATEDDALVAERAAADEQLADERVEVDKALERLLALERGDTDERLRIERVRADRAVASRDEFLAIVSHDVRNILGGIAMSADFLEQVAPSGTSGDRAHREVQRIRRLTLQMNRLVGDLLDVVSMESGALSLSRVEHDAKVVLTETLDNFQLAAAGRKVQITSQVGAGDTVASFDHERILQVLTNLVGNAIKFTPVGGMISVLLVPGVDSLEFVVRDNGRGIAPDQIEIMFERFSQAAQVDRRGLGLGLYIARCIVTTHGGRI
ncbi:MAG: HAMP domain-containing histidine kinase [Deltaproteobacteria bacterium]|nr:HAMP domain-containing histidine kinase [Deltaproteobacteria bacterium]